MPRSSPRPQADAHEPGNSDDCRGPGRGRSRSARARACRCGRRRSRFPYEGLAAFWSQQAGDWADLLNPLQKFVASRTLDGPLDWNAALIDGPAEEGVSRLKDELDGDLLLVGCGELARHLLANDLVDEVRFWLHPTVWGEGTRPYQGERVRMRLLEATVYDSGVTQLRYGPVN